MSAPTRGPKKPTQPAAPDTIVEITPSTADPNARSVALASPDDAQALGPLAQPGVWANVGSRENPLVGHGWNLIALPFVDTDPTNTRRFRLLLNQFNERLEFSLVDKNVPNRGVDLPNGPETDQKIAALDYEQSIMQIAVLDEPRTGTATTGGPGAAIHHEPGLFLHMQDQTDDAHRIGRLATIPHGDSVLALGSGQTIEGPQPPVAPVDAFPVGVRRTPEFEKYLEPYQHFIDQPFQRCTRPSGFRNSPTPTCSADPSSDFSTCRW